MKRLFVIGNGFDLHHNLKTDYNDFRHYLMSSSPDSYQFITDLISYYNPSFNKGKWGDLENQLACISDIDYEYVLDEAISSSETDLDRASYWDSIQYNANNFSQAFIAFKMCFDDWVDFINVRNHDPIENIKFKKEDRFLTFNYTNTLQQLYGVDDSKILHIHGKKGTDKVFGHNVSFSPLHVISSTVSDYDCCEDVDWRIEESKIILNQIPKIFYKDSEALITKYSDFFNSISNYDVIVFMGWSLSSQDEIYMDCILKQVKKNARLIVIYHLNDSTVVSNYQRLFDSFNINNNNVVYYVWEQISELFSDINQQTCLSI